MESTLALAENVYVILPPPFNLVVKFVCFGKRFVVINWIYSKKLVFIIMALSFNYQSLSIFAVFYQKQSDHKYLPSNNIDTKCL